MAFGLTPGKVENPGARVHERSRRTCRGPPQGRDRGLPHPHPRRYGLEARRRIARYQASWSSGGARAGASAGGSVGRPRCARILRTTNPSVSSAISLRGPPQ